MYDELIVKFMRDKQRESMDFPQGLTAFQVSPHVTRTPSFSRLLAIPWQCLGRPVPGCLGPLHECGSPHEAHLPDISGPMDRDAVPNVLVVLGAASACLRRRSARKLPCADDAHPSAETACHKSGGALRARHGGSDRISGAGDCSREKDSKQSMAPGAKGARRPDICGP